MIKLKDIFTWIKESSTLSSTDSEPDTGFLPKGTTRSLGKKNKPDKWFDDGGYTQLDFPKADDIFGPGQVPDFEVRKTKTPEADSILTQQDKELLSQMYSDEEWNQTEGKKDKGIKLKNIVSEGKYLSIFDFDDTLVKSLSWVYVMKNGKQIKKIDAAEFAVYKPKEDESFDFRDFDRKIREPKLIKRNVDLLKKQLSKGGRRVTILTARRLGAPVSSFLRSIGIDAYVVPLGDGNPQKKADYIEAQIKKGYNPIYFMDDSSKNISAVNKLQKLYPKTKIVTKHVKH